MTVPREVIDRVREAIDIAAIAGEHVQLKRVGQRFKGLCPFHKEKTPSFMVNPDMGIFKCFGCGAGGDVFHLIMELEKLSFPEALEHLASRAGIALPKQKWSGPSEDSVYPALEWAAGTYRQALAGPGGVPARTYLEQRGVAPATLERFGVGWALPGWSNLLDRAGQRYSAELLNRAGLAIKNEKGGHYDRFRGRVMIPIRSTLGKTIGFGARSMGDEEPKYLNSPETEVFVKSRVLYGLSEARDTLKDCGEVLVVEGYMDVMALAQAGLLNAVAACGTAFTADQGRILKRYVPRAVLLYDGDSAGLKAAWKAAAVFLGEGFDTRILTLPQGEDPDSFVRQEGADALRRLVSAAPGVVDFARDVLLDKTERREDLVRAFAYLGARIDDPIRRAALIQDAAEAFRFDIEVLKTEVRRQRGDAHSNAPAVNRPRQAKDGPGRAYVTAWLEGRAGAAEPLPAEVIREEAIRELFVRLLEIQGEEIDPMRALLEDDSYREVTAELLAQETWDKEPFAVVEAKLRTRAHKTQRAALMEAISRADSQQDWEEVERLNQELTGLRDSG